MNIKLSILEFKEIVNTIKEFYGVDLSQHAMGSLSRNISFVLKKSKYSTVSLFINGLKNDKMLYEKVLSCIYCEHVSLFREPALWRTLKDTVLDKILEKKPLKVWIPEVSNGSDYYSLLIYLHQNKLLKDSKIIISSQSHINLEKRRIGEINSSLLINSDSNFKRVDGHNSISSFIEKRGNSSFIKKELLTKTYIYKNSIEDIKLAYRPNLVMFRNRMLYYNHVKEQKIINSIHKLMDGGGFLITGVKENIGFFNIDKKFRLYNEDEQIYKRHF